jgi:hypothetical protein
MHCKGGPFSELRGDSNIAAMRLGNVIRNRQPQPGAARRASGIGAVEAIKEVRQMFGCNSNTGIADRYGDAVGVRGGADGNAALFCILDGIVEQVDEQARQAVTVALNQQF